VGGFVGNLRPLSTEGWGYVSEFEDDQSSKIMMH